MKVACRRCGEFHGASGLVQVVVIIGGSRSLPELWCDDCAKALKVLCGWTQRRLW